VDAVDGLDDSVAPHGYADCVHAGNLEDPCPRSPR
jgi:hypothetical protein